MDERENRDTEKRPDTGEDLASDLYDPNDLAAQHLKQYLDDDDDEESPLGREIFRSMFGFSINDDEDGDGDGDRKPELKD